MTEGVGFTSFLVSACRVKAILNQREANAEQDSHVLFDDQSGMGIMQWEYPVITHASCLAMLSSIMKSIAETNNAPSLCDLEGMDAWEFLLSTGSIKRIAMRTKFIDNSMLNTLNSNAQIKQVVVLGAGMDTRAFRLPLPPVRYYELDLPAVIDFKRELFMPSTMPSTSTPSHISLIGSDLTDPTWITHLIEQGFNPALPTLWVLEGLVMYLQEQTVQALLKHVVSLSVRGSHILLHTVNCKEVESNNPTAPSSTPDILSSLSSKMVYGVDNPHTLLAGEGRWENIESFNYAKIAKVLNCEGYLTDLTTNSLFTTAVLN